MAHPSIFGEYLVTAATLFAAGAYYLSGRARLVLGSLFVLTLPAIFLTYSRAVWIGLVVGGGTMVLVLLAQQFMARAGRTKLVRSAAVGLAVAALLLAGAMRFTPAGTFVRSAFDPTYGSNEERLEFLARLIAPLSDGEALVGRGLGDVLEQNFREVDVEIYDIASGASRTVQLTKNRTLVDNQYLKTFVEMGLAGLLIYSWLFWRFGAAAWKLVTGHQSRVTSHERRGADAPALAARVIGLWGVGFLAAFAVQGFFIDIWDIFPTNAAFWIVAAMVSAVSIPLASLNSTER